MLSVPVKMFPKWTLVFSEETTLGAGASRLRNLTPHPDVLLLHRTERKSAFPCVCLARTRAREYSELHIDINISIKSADE